MRNLRELVDLHFLEIGINNEKTRCNFEQVVELSITFIDVVELEDDSFVAGIA